MAVTVNNRWIRATASAAQTTFTYDFPITAKESIEIYHEDSSGVVTLLVFSTDYTLTGIGDAGGGTFELTSGATAGDKYTAVGITPFARTSDFSGKAEITTSSINNQYDDLTKQTQQNARDITRCIRIPVSDDIEALNTDLGSATDRANKYILFDASGDASLSAGTGGAANAGGSDTEIQYSNAGVLDGDSGFTTTGAGVLTIVGSLTTDNIKIDGNTISSEDAGGNIVITPNGTGIVTFGGSTEAIRLPVGTTAQRPGSPSTGYQRYNTTLSVVEFYNGSTWVSPATNPGGSTTEIQWNNAGVLDGDSGFTTDGSGGLTVTGSLDVDNITINGNTISSNDTNGNVTITPDGTGLITAGKDIDMNSFDIRLDDNTGIQDDTGAKQLTFQKTTTAVNNLEITNAATTNAPEISAAGSDANISINVTPKGAGIVNMATSTEAFSPPVGTTAQRPSAPAAGYTRFNSTESSLEVYNGSSWVSPTNAAGGSDTQVQYNSSGSLAGEAGFVRTGAGAYDISTSIDVANLQLSANQIISTDTNGDITITPDGTGVIVASSNIQVADAQGIVDGNGNEQLVFQQTASAVNQIEITNASTGNGPSITVTGDDTNVDLLITPKGTGITDLSGSTEAIRLPSGTTAQQPASPLSGEIRFNTTTSALETYDGSSWITQSGGSGDVTGPGSSIDNGIALFDGTGGTLLQDSGITWPIPTGGFVNKIINPSFDVWQRATSFTSIASSAYSADRWKYEKAGAAVHDLSRSTDVPTATEADHQFNYSALLDCTTADASIAAGDYVIFGQHIEGYNITGLSGTSFTLSFWVKATKTGIYCVSLRNSANDRSYVEEYTISSAATWEKKTITVSDFSSAGGTWDYTNGSGLDVRFALAVGSTFQTTTGAWNTGNFLGTSSQVNGVDSASNDFRITGVQIEKGSSAGAYDARSWQQEFSMCERYYQTSYNYGVAPGTASANSYCTCVCGPGTTQLFGSTNFPTRMRVDPTSTALYSFAGTANKWSNGAGADQSGTASVGIKESKIQGGGNSTALTVGENYIIHFTASSEL